MYWEMFHHITRSINFNENFLILREERSFVLFSLKNFCSNESVSETFNFCLELKEKTVSKSLMHSHLSLMTNIQDELQISRTAQGITDVSVQKPLSKKYFKSEIDRRLLILVT